MAVHRLRGDAEVFLHYLRTIQKEWRLFMEAQCCPACWVCGQAGGIYTAFNWSVDFVGR
jgi:hypothetical protein